jgi:hypothetical protein
MYIYIYTHTHTHTYVHTYTHTHLGKLVALVQLDGLVCFVTKVNAIDVEEQQGRCLLEPILKSQTKPLH